MVSLLWPLIFNTGSEIKFAYSSFRWANLASHNAGVTVVIVGIGPTGSEQKTLYAVGEDGELSRRIGPVVSPYLTIGSSVVIDKARTPQFGLPEMEFGNKPSDGGNLLLTRDQVEELGLNPAQRSRFIRKILGSEEFINGGCRYCIWIENGDLDDALKFPLIAERVENTRKVRLASPDKGANALARRAHQLKLMRIGKEVTVVIPAVSSERRPYIPVGIVTSDTTLTNLAFGIYDGEVWHVAVLSSRLHLAWVKTVCGQLETRLRYSNTMGWNTFPGSQADRKK